MSRSTDYAITSVIHIAQAEGIVRSQDIAKEHDIPLEYLLKILQALVRAGILKSKRGPRGGFEMDMKASKVSMLEVIEAVDGPIFNDVPLLKKKAYNAKLAEEEKYRKGLGQIKISSLV